MTQARPVRTRIAPSPTGEPHIGNLYVALVNWALARQGGGQFLVRIEDTDRTRFVPGAEAMFLEALRWLGLDHDEGPDCGGPFGPYRQSERTDLYRREAERLLAGGGAYRCFCSPDRLEALRQEQMRAGAETIGYDRRCRALSPEEAARRHAAGEPSTVRLAVPADGQTRFTDGLRGEIVIENRLIDDQVLLKSDGYPTYHLASVVDDHLMGITDVIRAEEWITSTPKHILLYRALGWEPPAFHHLPLIRNPDRSKLSKRKNPTNVLWYRQQGYLAEAAVNFLGMLGHSMPDGREVFTREEFRDAFSWARVTATGPIFDLEKFEWLNGMWVRRLSAEDLAARLRAGGFMPDAFPARYPPEKVLAIVRLMQERLRKLSEFADGAAFFIERLPYDAADLVPMKKQKVAQVAQGDPPRRGDSPRRAVKTAAETASALAELRALAASAEPFSAAAMEGAVRALSERLGWKAGDLFMALRVAVTMRRVSTPLFETMEVLGRQECLARLDEAMAKVHGLV